ncbi:hypothetical protein GGI07_003275 [Coemansia sp. Benny D115]|nr:hypothetical protein GGI07_003275 [Coemansia sp. Benny D115]
MKLSAAVAQVTVVALCVSQSVSALALNMTKRTVTFNNLINDFRGAVLIHAGLQTSCEVALIDTQNGFVAASCLKILSTGKADDNEDYKVAIFDPVGQTSKMFTLDRIDVHPKYDQSTYANNIAIIGFNTGNSQSWVAWVGGHRTEWNNIFYTNRAMTSVLKKTWDTSYAADIATNSNCGAASNLYKSNSDWMTCITQAPASRVQSACLTPYGTAWGVYQPNDLAVSAIYSHSVTTSSSLCQTTGTVYHLYTMLQPYIKWATNIAGRDMNLFWKDSSYSYSGSRSFAMSSVGGSSISGAKIVTGDLYPMQRTYTPVSVPSTPSTGGGSSESSGGSSGGSSSGSSGSTGGTGSSGGSGSSGTNSGSSGSNSGSSGSNTGSSGTNSGSSGSNSGSSGSNSGSSGGDDGSSSGSSGSSGSNNKYPNNNNSGSSGSSGNTSGSDNSGSNDSGSNNSGNTDNSNSGNSGSGGSSGSGSSKGNDSGKSSDKDSKSDVSTTAGSSGRTGNMIEEDDYVTISGSVVPIINLMTDSNQEYYEFTRVNYITETDADGNIIVVSNIEVETYAYADYADYMDDDDDDDDNNGKSTSSGDNKDNQKQTAAQNNGSGLGRNAIIAVSVTVSVVTILILAGLFFLKNWWRRRRNASSWDPKNENANLDRIRIIDEISSSNGSMSDMSSTDSSAPSAPQIAVESAAVTSQRLTLPPNYEAHGFDNTSAPVEKLPIP